MSQRRATKWVWCLLAWFAGAWSPAIGVTVRSPPKNPTTIEAQAKFFQYRHLPTHEDYDQGHRQGSERHFTERHERARPSDGLFSAKVRWGDKQGGYGEHYWDLNHAGHAGDHGNDEYDGSSDDGSYNHDLDHAYDGNDGHDSHNDHDAYDEPSEQSPVYGTEEYDPENAAKYDENGRAKRAHPKIKTERTLIRGEELYEEEPQVKPHRINRKPKERLQAASTQQVENVAKDANVEQPLKRKRQQRRHQNPQQTESEHEEQKNQDNQPKEDSSNQEQQQTQQYYKQRQENQFVPYEQGAGVRQHHRPEIAAAASVPRLFLEPTTGHVVDRATGQAYVLQPITVSN